MVDLSTLQKIGATSAAWLRAAGVETVDELERLGALEAWRRAKRAYPDWVTLNLLYALEGALLGLPWTEMPADVKRRLAEAARAVAVDGPNPPTPGDDGGSTDE
jgi:DNA transformation protein